MTREILYKDTDSLQEIISTFEECGALAEHDKKVRKDIAEEIKELLTYGMFCDEKITNVKRWIKEQLEEDNK